MRKIIIGLSVSLAINVGSANANTLSNSSVSGSEVQIRFSSAKDKSQSADELIKILKEKALLSREQLKEASEITARYQSALEKTEVIVGWCNALSSQKFHFNEHLQLHSEVCSAELQKLHTLSSDILAFVQSLPELVSRNEGTLAATNIALSLVEAQKAARVDWDESARLKMQMLQREDRLRK